MPTSAAIRRTPGSTSPGSILYTAKDTWLGPTQNLGSIGALYNLTMDPYEKYDMIFNGAMSTRALTTSPGRYAGQDNGWVGGIIGQVMLDFDETVIKFPSISATPAAPRPT